MKDFTASLIATLIVAAVVSLALFGVLDFAKTMFEHEDPFYFVEILWTATKLTLYLSPMFFVVAQKSEGGK